MYFVHISCYLHIELNCNMKHILLHLMLPEELVLYSLYNVILYTGKCFL